MKVEIKGIQFENKGAALMLYAILDQMRSWHAGARPVLLPGPLSPWEERTKVGAWQKLSIRRRWLDLNGFVETPVLHGARVWLNKYGVVTEADVDMVLDASGYAYGDAWTDWNSLHLAGEIRRSAERRRPYIFLPQAFGPFGVQRVRRALSRSLPLASLICVRDEQSETYLRDLCAHELDNVVRFPDFTPLITGDTDAASRWAVEDKTVLLIPNQNMVGRNAPDFSWRGQYVDLLIDIGRACESRGLQVVVLNHAGSADREICNAVAYALGSVRQIEEPDPMGVKGLIGASYATVSSRFHGCVSALSQRVPCLGTSWSHKYQELFRDYGATSMLLATCDRKAAMDTVAVLLDPSYRMQLSSGWQPDHQKELARTMWATVWERVAECRPQ